MSFRVLKITQNENSKAVEAHISVYQSRHALLGRQGPGSMYIAAAK